MILLLLLVMILLLLLVMILLSLLLTIVTTVITTNSSWSRGYFSQYSDNPTGWTPQASWFDSRQGQEISHQKLRAACGRYAASCFLAVSPKFIGRREDIAPRIFTRDVRLISGRRDDWF